MTQKTQGKLAEKVALITGGTSGIGLATAELFIAEGARVIVTGSTEASLARSATRLAGAERAVVCDATSAVETKRLFDGIAGDYGKLDILFLNAGILRMAPLGEMEESLFDEVLAVDLKAPWLGLRAALPHLQRGSSVIVNTSVANHKGVAGLAAYAAAKGGLRALVRSAVAELAPAGIRVNAVSPGPTFTPIFEKLGLSPGQAVQAAEAVIPSIPIGRLGKPEDIARAVLFLASEDSSFVVGAELVVDGGMSQV